ncbi:MAG: hypothetical protein N2653_14045, partial [Burkholderiales bacterium]|nr:hypothetical protein [Burkholderiales bacterium]
CPRPAPQCRRPVSVPSGGEVVVFLYEGKTPRYVRALYRAGPEAPLVSGLLDAAELDIEHNPPPVRAESLVGTWRARIRRTENEANLELRRSPGGLEFTLFSELFDDRGVKIRDAPFRQTKGLLRITTDPYLTHSEPARGGRTCTLFFVPLGRYLLVHDDEDRCADVGEIVRYTGLYVRVAAPAAPAPAAPIAAGALPAIEGYTLEPNRSRAETGSVYRNIARGEVTLQSCAQACSGDRPCVGFTLLPGVPGVSGPDCRLLQSAGTAEERPGAVSGLRQK